jgi:hypothetical protein
MHIKQMFFRHHHGIGHDSLFKNIKIVEERPFTFMTISALLAVNSPEELKNRKVTRMFLKVFL